MLRYTCTSLLFLALLSPVFAQDYTQSQSEREQQNIEDQEGTPRAKKEKIPYPDKKRGTELGIDISRFLLPVFDEDRFALEAHIRTNIGKRTFFAGALGSETVSFDDKSYTYESTGFFARAGIDYDIFVVEDAGNNDNILIGLRYGYALQEHESGSITIEDGYWGDYHSSVSPYTFSTHWVEAIFGLRSEVLNNFYMSWMIHLKLKISSGNSELLEPYAVPGYGNGSNAFNLGFSYVVGYQIPWGNKKAK
ncbi:DUF6048 family protein [Saccharicrinis fermentans]|uniref:Outer membrane protein beta-barrel domain-containing protein n=1 Tax=Saccharicrinis fermentans DSM 9555 = JCM 21142 TaxID=869213 RepID=W7Y6X8_9BACT|nr:DUF6048 family protein [Saccharicrinis fermentans]GAF03413.1 hypothetical protein JCM21142_42086 [Saccharicrinis fermentans DSM 9555 = JCM 21142]